MQLLNFGFYEILQDSQAELSGQEKWRRTREQSAKWHGIRITNQRASMKISEKKKKNVNHVHI